MIEAITTKICTFADNQTRILCENKQELDASRVRLLKAYLLVTMFIGLVQGVLSFFVEENFSRRPYYFLVAAGIALIYIILHRGKKPLQIFYISFGVLTAYVSYTNAYISNDRPSVLIICLLFVFPLFIPDKSWRIVLCEVLMACLYLFVVEPNKPDHMIVDEITNVLLAVVSSLSIGEVVRSIQLENFDLKRQAFLRERTDPLTGLPNRRQLFEDIPLVDKHVCTCSVGVLVLDIDFFKSYNDTYGHHEGDNCLEKIGQCLSSFSQENGLVLYRFGGEEFVGIMKDCTEAGLEQVCSLLTQRVRGLNIPHEQGVQPYVTMSVGYTRSEAHGTESYETLFSQADTALYTAKNSGRNCICRYTLDMQTVDPEHKRVPMRRATDKLM